jgi:hypothetical protein
MLDLSTSAPVETWCPGLGVWDLRIDFLIPHRRWRDYALVLGWRRSLVRCRPSKSRNYRWAIITIDYTTAHIASLRPSLLASRTFPLGCGSNSFPAISRLG